MNIDSRPGSTLRAKALAFATEIVQSSARDVVQVLFRRKWVIVLFFGGVSAAAGLYAFTAPAEYESEAKLLVRMGRENLQADPSLVAGPMVGGMSQSRENEVNSEISILTSRILAEQVVDAVSPESLLDKPHKLTPKERVYETLQKVLALPVTLIAMVSPQSPSPARERAIKLLLLDTSVEVEKKTNIINVAFDAKNSEVARKTLDALVDAYMERHIKVHQSQASPQFFEDKVAESQEKLAQREKERDAYRVSKGISSIDKQKETLLAQLSTLDGERSNAAADVEASDARVASLEKTLRGISPTLVTSETSGIPNATTEKLKSDLHDLQLKETDMAARYPASYRPLAELRAQIKQAEAMIKNEQASLTTKTTGLDPNHQQLQLQLETERAARDSQKARETSIAAEIEHVKTRLADITAQETESTRLDRDVEVANQEYREYHEGLQRARMSEAMDKDKVANVSVVQPATAPTLPVRPQKMRVLALGLFLGLFGGVSLAYAREYMDDTLHNKEDAEAKLGVPVITNKEFIGSF
jgi:uncharacterized protein involved in exopolysaccharide biosynthesis